LEKSFGDWPVLWDLDLTVGWGELLVLFGANGVGKTTLLRILSTQTKPDAGTLMVAGYSQRRQPEAVRRRVGVVGHQTFLYQDLTCRENLVHYGRLFGLEDYRRRAAEALSRVGLADRADRLVRTLSNGMQKRLSVARATLHQPQLLLLDEPEAGLDRESVAILKSLLEEWTEAGRSVVMITHDVELGLSWANRAAVLQSGRIHFPSSDEYRDDASLRRMLAASPEPGR
tara:strand:+ start:7707 stop:8393 length:687 start_codon:yes stop_codon:yes gene_type:complete